MVDRLRVTELDFDTIKGNLRAFLQQQKEFSDYDFSGSGLSVLLDILAYNTHYNAYYLNMVANESFLDTSLLRESTVSHAKTLGYIPHSKKSPTATITLTANSSTTTAGTLTIPEGFSFLSDQIDGKSYNFVSLEEQIVSKINNSQYVFTNLEINEGQLITNEFPFVQSSNPKQIFTLPEKNIDTTTLKVIVRPNIANTSSTVYSKVNDVLNVDGTSDVYFLQENRDGNYEIYFGNNSVGRKLNDGATISVTYLVTNGTDSNKANNFVQKSTLADSNGDSTNIVITPISAASGGSDKETVDSIKFSAPNQFTTQNRLVTKKDYETTILKEVPSIEAISVWGGEDNDPVVYGKIFISLKPRKNFFISETEKNRIVDNIIKPKSIIGIETELVDPSLTFILITTNVLFDNKKTAESEEAFKASIKNSIVEYNNTNLNRFDSNFSLSKLSKAIDETDRNSIIGSETSVRVQKRISPVIGTSSYTLDFGEKLKRGTTTDKLTTTQFSSPDSTGVVRNVELEETPFSSTGISRITIHDPGFGYTIAPEIIITGDGTGAKAIATVSGGEVTSVVITDRGKDYTNAQLTLSGGNGTGASLSVSVDSRNGTIRSIFFDDDGNRNIINDNAGSIDYDKGVIEINNINIRTVTASDGLIRLTIGAESGIIESTRNNIVAIDIEDPLSITTTLQSTNL